MTDWTAVLEDDCRLPEGVCLDDLVAELAECLRHPDPEIRDGDPYVVLRTLIERDVIAGGLRLELGDLMARRFEHPDIQARTFAPLVLTMIVERGDVRPEWIAAFSRWYADEEDLRGHDDELGWLHAVAHGADLLGALGAHPAVAPEPLVDLAARRLVAPTVHVWREREDDRLADALGVVLARPELDEAAAVAWIDVVGAAFRAAPRGVSPAFASNALRTLRALYVNVDAGPGVEKPVPVRHREAVKAALLRCLRTDAALVG